MERIKHAIENVKKPESNRVVHLEPTLHNSKYTKIPTSTQAQRDLRGPIKIAIAVILIFLGSLLWMRLDFMNQLELGASEQIHAGIEQARLEARRRQQDKTKFEQLILANFNFCQEAADKAKSSYVKLVQEAMPDKQNKPSFSKQDRVAMSKAIAEQSTKMLADAKAECKLKYDLQLKNGK